METKITKTKKEVSLRVDREMLMKLIAKHLLKIKGGTDYTFTTNLPPQIYATVKYVEKLTPEDAQSRQDSLKLASGVLVKDVLSDFKKSTTANKSMVSAFCNRINDYFGNKMLSDLISEPISYLKKFRGVGEQNVLMLEEYLNQKGHRFAIWTGKEYV
jgi:hypothetical protein